MFEKHNLKIEHETEKFAMAKCPKCKTNALLGDKNNNDFFCHNCGYSGNEKSYINTIPIISVLEPLTKSHNNWLSKLKLEPNNENQEIYTGIHYFVKEKTWESSIKLTVKQNKNDNAKIQNVIGLKANFEFEGLINNPFPLGYEKISQEKIVIVNHPLDYLACIKAGMTSVICPPNPLSKNMTQNNLDFLKTIEEPIKKAEKIILAFDNSELSKEIEEELARRISKEKCFKVQWDTPKKEYGKDFLNIGRASSMLIERNPRYLKNVLNKAKAFPINGIYELDDVEDEFEILYEFGLQKGLSTGWPSVDDLYSVALKQWTLVTGIPGHGKSNWLDALLVNLAKQYGWKFGLFSPENQPIERHFAGLTEKYIGAPFLDNIKNHPKMTVEQKNKGKKWINKHFKAILPKDGMDWSIDGILELAKQAVYRHGIRGLVIDPWNELDHSRPAGVTETDHISKCVTKIRRFARVYEMHIWIVAHPTKLYRDSDGKYPVPTLYDVSGGAHWRNKADNGIVVWRNVGGVDERVNDIHVQKIRFKEIGKVGRASLRSDDFGGQYIDDIDQELREKSLREEEPWPTTALMTSTKKNNYEAAKEQDKQYFDEQEVEVTEKQTKENTLEATKNTEDDIFDLSNRDDNDLPF